MVWCLASTVLLRQPKDVRFVGAVFGSARFTIYKLRCVSTRTTQLWSPPLGLHPRRETLQLTADWSSSCSPKALRFTGFRRTSVTQRGLCLDRAPLKLRFVLGIIAGAATDRPSLRLKQLGLDVSGLPQSSSDKLVSQRIDTKLSQNT